MKINAELVIKLRKERSWSQDELAVAAGLNLRTIQRIESDGLASLQSKKALAAALDIDVRDLENEGVHMKGCPSCGSNELYQYKKDFGDTVETLLPKLGSALAVARLRTTVCANCGYVQIFASEDARKKLKASTHWKAVTK
jgi:transcriptional regulator with XRE-family HTH domain